MAAHKHLREQNSTDLVYQHEEYGGAQTLHTAGGRKTLVVFVCFCSLTRSWTV